MIGTLPIKDYVDERIKQNDKVRVATRPEVACRPADEHNRRVVVHVNERQLSQSCRVFKNQIERMDNAVCRTY